MVNAPLILASSSAYRRALLERLQWPFEVLTPAVDETVLPGESPAATALRLAESKAYQVAESRKAGLVIGSDQVADRDGHAVGKPRDHDDAVRMLSELSGRTVVFHTALALVNAANGRVQRECVDVTSRFRVLGAAEIDAYLRREQPYDCAGAVKAEALGIALFESIQSDDPTALIGLPLIALVRMLRAEGLDVLALAP